MRLTIPTLLLLVACVADSGVAPPVEHAPRGDSPAVLATLHPTVAVQPTPEPVEPPLSLVLGPEDRVRVLTYKQWRAIAYAFPPEERWTAARTAFCESSLNPDAVVIDVNGYMSVGAWQVQPAWWGPVPKTLEEQARQVADIVRSQRDDPRGAWWPFAGSDGCSEWNR